MTMRTISALINWDGSETIAAVVSITSAYSNAFTLDPRTDFYTG